MQEEVGCRGGTKHFDSRVSTSTVYRLSSFSFFGGGASMSLFSLHHSAISYSIDQMLRLEVVTKSGPRSCGSVSKWLAAFLSPYILLRYEIER